MPPAPGTYKDIIAGNTVDFDNDPGTPLLGADDPAPATVTIRPNREWLVVCDHASNRFPKKLGSMGLDAAARAEHIAWDIGAALVAERVAERLDAPAIACNYSRLVIDCNRYPDAEDAAPEVSDGVVVPGNAALGAEALAQRAAEIARPYHATIAHHLEETLAAGVRPVFLSIHTCTASMDGTWRPWPIGLAWNRDDRFSLPVLEHLKAADVGPVGENEPYSLDFGADFTTPEHALARGLTYLQVEFRNDLVATPDDARRYADILADAILAAATPEVMDACRLAGDYLRPGDPVRGDFVTI